MEPAADTRLDGLKPQHQICAAVPMRLAHLPDSLVDLIKKTWSENVTSGGKPVYAGM